MSADDSTSKTFSLRRWSERKLATARPAPEDVSTPVIAPAPAPANTASANPAGANRASVAGQPADQSPEPETLPPIDSLTIDSDFTAYLRPKVEEGLKRLALKQLFRDPRFNVMDGLDVYIDDYSKPDPISADVVRDSVQGRYIFAPPETRVSKLGIVEDVPAIDPVPVPGAPPATDASQASGEGPPTEGSQASGEGPPTEGSQASGEGPPTEGSQASGEGPPTEGSQASGEGPPTEGSQASDAAPATVASQESGEGPATDATEPVELADATPAAPTRNPSKAVVYVTPPGKPGRAPR